MALMGDIVAGETPLTEEDLLGLKLPLVKTREQLLSLEYLQELHRRMLGDVWQWAGEIRSIELQNTFAAPVPDIRPQLSILYADAVEYWLADKRMTPDEFAVRVHHRVVKTHPFRNGNGRHSRLIADIVLARHFGLEPFTWGGNATLGNSDPNRQKYLYGLKAADRGNYGPLLDLCRAI